MTTLENTAKKLGFTYSEEQAMSGSKYYRINSIKFRISDHTQPSHYQARQYFDVSSENQIIDIISNDLFGKTFNPAIIDGKFYNMIYDAKLDHFNREELTEEGYSNLVALKEAQREFYINSGFAGEIN